MRPIGKMHLAGLAVVLALAGCGGQTVAAGTSGATGSAGGSSAPPTSGGDSTGQGSASAGPTMPARPDLGTVSSSKHPGITVTVNKATESADGLLAVVWTIRNGTGNDANIDDLFWTPGDFVHNYVGGGVSGVTITDRSAKQRYYPMQDKAANCLCYKGNDKNDNGAVPAHGTRTVFDLYRPDTPPYNIDIGIKGFGTVKNVRVGAA